MTTSKAEMEQDAGEVRLERDGAIVTLTLARPHALNAITWAMYEQLDAHIAGIAADATVRAVVLRGDGGRAFASGTDIRQFEGFTGEDGVAYEKRLDAAMERVVSLPMPVIAAIQGYAVGGGLLLAAACDLRYATPSSRIGAPMSRTLGNCLSMANYRRLVAAVGAMRVKELLFTGRLLSAEEALHTGFLTAVLDGEDFDGQVAGIARELAERAPLTLWATKEALRRLDMSVAGVAGQADPPLDDVTARVYGSADFREGVRAHIEKRPPIWRGE